MSDNVYVKKDFLGNVIRPLYQWVNGVKMMSPAPNPNHGITVARITSIVDRYLLDKTCRYFSNPTDLTLRDPNTPVLPIELKRPVNPDLFVFCENEFEWIANNIIGIPDFVLEVISPGSWRMDFIEKKKMYLDAGVKEYWIVDYLEKIVFKYYDGKEEKFTWDDTVKVETLEGLSIDFKLVEKALLKRRD